MVALLNEFFKGEFAHFVRAEHMCGHFYSKDQAFGFFLGDVLLGLFLGC